MGDFLCCEKDKVRLSEIKMVFFFCVKLKEQGQIYECEPMWHYILSAKVNLNLNVYLIYDYT